ncbi:MAG TPA: tRNA lysidine(34) synthetase TilS [Pyrinomonadaceae bacterium]|nr:tRNA lysidine(34) synthetase TilS [Pyrinomonadaceae bacterium]
MNDFVRNLLTEWRKLELPFEEKTFVAAVSGGADSVALLLALEDLRKREKLKNRFVIAHFNHNLRGEESEKDVEFVRSLCIKFNFEFAVGTGHVSTQGNLEQNARLARYDFLRKTAENLHAYAVLTAHTINDQAETFLINLIRGSGLQGLSGMNVIRFLEDQSKIQNPKSKILLVRPLLNWAKRADTENFCRECEIEPRYDTMNEDLAFKRVRVRKVLLPLLEDFNPKIVETLANTASLMQRQISENSADDNVEFTEELPLNELKNLSKAQLYNNLRLWLARHRGNLRELDLKHIEAVERLIHSRKSGKTVELPNEQRVIKENGRLLFKNLKVEK